ncbi:MAG: hypothetical protein CFK49_05895 [Armatimonadetes bacterium JP3_11]|jgi:hypothetical protein|nr:MAG: hypothetical protein CFK48_01695 [Armatimonadetes bacterium CP1_7O]OYT74915.1 MAG: hypothetical protein CFK49_05895 [Armatimonadetes bacterium JP3_11]RMH08055.1 MAG: hypothetical protein D6697_06985 [Armatimonadota bacterium]
MTRLLGWLTALVLWGGLFYATTLTEPLILRQRYEIAKHARPDAEYQITRAERLTPSAERYKGRFHKAGNTERLEWAQGNQLAILEWTVIHRRSPFIHDGEPIIVLPMALQTPIKQGATIRMIRMSYPLGYYFVIVDKRGEVVGVLEVYWNT